MEHTQQALEELVVGKPAPTNAVFYEKAALDVAESNKQGQRVYKNTVYIKVTAPGVKDSVSYVARPQDIKDYPEAWEQFQNTRQGNKRTVGVEIIPNLKLEHMQELIDIGLGTLEKLAEADEIPPHLEYARQSAVMLNTVLQEQANASKEESDIKESPIETENVPTLRRQDEPHPVGRPEPEAGTGRIPDQAAEGYETGGQAHHREGINPIDNWKVELSIVR